MNKKAIVDFKTNLKLLVAQAKMGEAITELLSRVPPTSQRFNEIIALSGRLTDLEGANRMGITDEKDYTRTKNQLRQDVLALIDALSKKDFKKSSKSKKKKKNSTLLYRIPELMQLNTETKCVVRLAYLEKQLLENFEIDENTKLKSVRIAEVMGVELIDANDSDAFKIRTYSSSVQHLYEDDFSEWIFYVKPIREGAFSLLLKVAIVEIINGVERSRDLILEEFVTIVVDEPQVDTAPKFADYQLSMNDDGGKAAVGVMNGIRKYAGVLAFVLITSIGALAFERDIRFQYALFQNTIESYDDFINRYKSGRYVDDASFRKALLENTIEGYQDYIQEFEPRNGEHLEEAYLKIAELTEEKATNITSNQSSSIQGDSVNAKNTTDKNIINVDAGGEEQVDNIEEPTSKQENEKIFVKPTQKKYTVPDKEKNAKNNSPYPALISVKAGSFIMGNNAHSDEAPAHKVAIQYDYKIGKYEVTNAQFVLFLSEEGNKIEGGETWISLGSRFSQIVKKGNTFSVKPGFEHHPVAMVSWFGARAYCKWLTKKTGKKYRLPTEAEWEFAANGGNNSKNYTYSGGNSIASVAWFRSNSKQQTHETGTKNTNELFIADMTGNVWEWCADQWHQNYKGAPTDGSSWLNGNYRVLRGGSWNSKVENCHITKRISYNANGRGDLFGFRVVRE